MRVWLRPPQARKSQRHQPPPVTKSLWKPKSRKRIASLEGGSSSETCYPGVTFLPNPLSGEPLTLENRITRRRHERLDRKYRSRSTFAAGLTCDSHLVYIGLRFDKSGTTSRNVGCSTPNPSSATHALVMNLRTIDPRFHKRLDTCRMGPREHGNPLPVALQVRPRAKVGPRGD